jgi:hypothetical protein
LHDKGYRLTWPPVISNLTPREQRLLMLSAHADAYQQQEARSDTQNSRPDHFGSPSESRRDAFQ